MDHIGIDVHKRESQIYILAEGGEIIERRIRTEPERFAAMLDDVGHFHHAHQLEAYLGLVPRQYSSGETQRRGAITKAGHSRTRWLLIQAAVSILRRRPPEAEELRAWALRIAARRGQQVAVVALARRLAGILYALLRDDSVFEPQRVRHPRPTAAALVAM
jgi:transposase